MGTGRVRLGPCVTKTCARVSNATGTGGSRARERRTMPQYRFNVFGRLVVIKGAPGNWSAFMLGTDGKRRKADFVVPGSLGEGELCQYLSDLFHESASSTQRVVTRLD